MPLSRFKKELVRPRRSMLYVPADRTEFLNKAVALPADSLILELHEAVPAANKSLARANMLEVLNAGDYGKRELNVRVNRRDTPYHAADMEAVHHPAVVNVLIPGIPDAQSMSEACQLLPDHAGTMVVVDSAMAAMNLDSLIKAATRPAAVVVETNALSHSMRLHPDPERSGVLAILSMVVLVARANRLPVIDGPFMNLSAPEIFELHCRQARNLGFDGKSTIHPNQLKYTNEAFTPRPAELDLSKRIIQTLEEKREQGGSIVVLDGRVVEPFEIERAYSVLALDEMIRDLG